MEHLSDSLLGVAEVAALIGLSRPALASRRERDDFPSPVAQLACGPIWARQDIERYAMERAGRFHERGGLERLAAQSANRSCSPPSAVATVPLGDGARLLGVHRRRLAAAAASEGFGVTDDTGEVVAVERDALGLLGRVLGRHSIEVA